jgi:ADP-ribosyl-[dinitrogen reductase] hydrolase
VAADCIAGAILGCALGDAMGLPYEGLSRRRGVRLLGEPDRLRLVFRHGMVSDDTEHTCMVAQSLCECPRDADLFARCLARQLRWWLLGLPAGIGFATLRAILRLWVGFSPQRSGVFSAGNGPAMRSAILGAAIDDLGTLEQFVHASTVITHSDPKAYHGALAVALAAWCAKRGLDSRDGFFGQYHALPGYVPSDEFRSLMLRVERSLASGTSTEAFAREIGCARGVSGYIYNTVPVAIHCWLAHPRDFRKAVAAVIRCGGDTDTTGAIVGAIVGSAVGRAGIPGDWLARLWEWPRSVAWMERLAEATGRAVNGVTPISPPRLSPAAVVLRNAVFLTVILTHAIRRLLPPY